MNRNASGQVGKTSTSDQGSRGEKGGVQSILRAFRILEVIAKSRDGINLADLSKAVQLHNSTTFHIVRTMVQVDYVRQDPETKRYRLGRSLYQLAAATIDEVELARISKIYVNKLAEETGETSHFAVPFRDSVVVLSKAHGTSAFQLADNMGAVRPAHATAIGKLNLAYMTPGALDAYFTDADLERFTDATIVDRPRLRAELEIVRENRMAFDDAEYHPELRCAAVPVFDMTDTFVGALGISGAVWRLSLSALQGKVPILRDIATELSGELGWRREAAE